MKTLKKLMLVVLCFIMMIAFSACGAKNDNSGNSANGEEKTESQGPAYGWYDAKVPEGFANTTKYYEVFSKKVGTSTHIIKVYLEQKKVEDSMATYLKSSGREQGEDVTIGNYTWKTVKFKWNGNDSVFYFTQINDKYCIQIDGFEMGSDDEDMKTFLESFKVDKDADLSTLRQNWMKAQNEKE